MKKKFLKRDTARFSKFGKRRKKLLSWRKPKGRDNKMREMRRGYPAIVKIGYKKEEHVKSRMINNVNDLSKLQKGEVAILGAVGKKKKLEIIKEAEKMKIKMENANNKSFLKKNEKKEVEVKK
ncbi:MAG: hypothetical protein KC516_01760 [Nanoarchaeota archaeon]|nr:hypothetical protein [Nanoarchaeota archaeon]